MASAFGGNDFEHTCRIDASALPTRRDYAIANRAALELIRGFHVDHDAGLPVHSVLQIRFCYSAPEYPRDIVVLPKSLHQAFANACVSIFHSENLATAKQRSERVANKQSKFVCNVDIQGPPQYVS